MNNNDIWQKAVADIKHHGFWFVDIPRTSSSSIKLELSKQYGIAYGKSDILEKQHVTAQVLKPHIPAVQFRQAIGHQIWDSIYKFSFVRNPWDRVLSFYHYRIKVKRIHDINISFREYVLQLGEANENTPGFMFQVTRYGAYNYLYDQNDNLLVDYVGKYETRENDLKVISEKIGASMLGSLHVQKASPDNSHYSNYYDDETIDVIYNLYRRDIEAFNYRFEEAA